MLNSMLTLWPWSLTLWPNNAQSVNHDMAHLSVNFVLIWWSFFSSVTCEQVPDRQTERRTDKEHYVMRPPAGRVAYTPNSVVTFHSSSSRRAGYTWRCSWPASRCRDTAVETTCCRAHVDAGWWQGSRRAAAASTPRRSPQPRSSSSQSVAASNGFLVEKIATSLKKN